MSFRPRLAAASVLGCSAAILFAACGDDTNEDGGGSDLAEVSFEQEAELFPGFSYDTGLQPAGSPVQASFAVSALGTATVTAVAAASGSDDEPTLSGLPEQGGIALGGGFALLGNLVVDIDGLPSYDGPIPGIENVEIPFEGATTYDPFAIDDEAAASAPIEPARLPGIPLPGGIPGQLVLEVVEGSSVDATLSGRSVCVDDGEALYAAGLARGGVLVIRPVVEIEVPLAGTQSFEIPEFSVDLALGTIDLAMTADVERYGARPSDGDHVEAACSTGGAGGGGTGSTTTATGSTGETSSSTAATGPGPGPGSTGSGTTACEDHADCAPYPCVEGTCSPGGGLCDSGYTYEDEYVDQCVTDYCCDGFAACTYDYTDVAGCNDCLANGGGARCDAYLDCLYGSCLGYPFCDGYAAPTQEQADCYDAYCCGAFATCVANGDAACEACLNNGGGPECDVVFTCISDYGCPPLF